MTTKEIYTQIINSRVFYSSEDDIDLCEKLIELCAAINNEKETDWSIGEFEIASLDALIIGAYWALTEWHGGQNSPEYSALCQLGTIFQPNMAAGPEDDSSEKDAYDCFDAYLREKNEASRN